MKVIKKAILIGASAATIGGLGITSLAGAANNTNGTSLIDKIAAKFNLNKDEVKAVFEENRSEMQAQRLADISERLRAAVDRGDITAEQKTLIENKVKEIQSTRDSERTDLENWATQNSIDIKYLMGHGMRDGSDNRLQDAVDNGDITAEQKTLIESKRTEMEQKRTSDRDALKKWADDNDIDMKYLMFGRGRGMGMHP